MPMTPLRNDLRSRVASRFARVLLLVASCGLFVACGAFGLGEEERIGLIRFHDDSTVFDVPDSVAADSTFLVSFYTFGGGCVHFGRTRLLVDGRTVRVIPYDVDSGADACTADIAFLDHTTEVRFEEPGTATVLIVGRVMPGDSIVERSFTIEVN